MLAKRELAEVIFAAILMAAGFLLQISWFFLLAAVLAGWQTIFSALRGIWQGEWFDESFLMTIAAAGAVALGEWPEAAAVLLLSHIGGMFEESAEARSRTQVQSLLALRPEKARVLRAGGALELSPAEVAVGETIRLLPGERVPLDSRVLRGESRLDTAALTGESLPRQIHAGEDLLAGCVNLSGVLEAEVLRTEAESTVSRILALVEDAAEAKGRSQRFLTRFSRWYTPAVCLAALLLACVPVLFGQSFALWAHRALVMLVASCPCALVFSVPLCFFAGVGGAARGGVLIKGGAALEKLAQTRIVAFDKTGTLTEGVFSVQQVLPAVGVEQSELLALAAAAEAYSTHPLAQALIAAAEPAAAAGDVQELAGRGVQAQVAGRRISCGNAALMAELGLTVPDITAAGSLVYVAADERYLGAIVVGDRLRTEAAEAIERLRQLGVTRFALFSGDRAPQAAACGRALALTEVHAELLPAQKVAVAEELHKELPKHGRLLFVGDGINDAPLLAQADVGCAMGAFGSDAAVEAADMVVLTDDLRRIPFGMRQAQRTMQIVRQNVVFALAVKAAILALGAFGLAQMWQAVFADVGVSVLCVLNAMRALSQSADSWPAAKVQRTVVTENR